MKTRDSQSSDVIIIGGGAQRVQRGVPVEVERLLGGDPPARGGTVEDGLKVGLLGHRSVPFVRVVDSPNQPTPGPSATRRQAALAGASSAAPRERH